MLSFWLQLVYITVYIAQCQITNRKFKYQSYRSRRSFLKGMFLAEPRVKSPKTAWMVGENLTVSCRSDTPGSRLRITHSDVTLRPSWRVNNTLYVKVNNITLQEGGIYYCFQNKKLIGSKEILVGHLPEAPRDIKCVSDNYESMACSWNPQNQDRGLISRSQLKYCVRLDVDGFNLCRNLSSFSDCPHPSVNPPSCQWMKIDSKDYRDAFKPAFIYHMVLNVTNKLGHAISQIRTVSTQHIVKPNHVVNLSSAALSSSDVKLTWRTTIPDTLPGAFQYEVKNSIEDNQPLVEETGTIYKSGQVFVVIENLQPSSRYVFSVRVKPQLSGFWSDARITRVTTLAADQTVTLILSVGVPVLGIVVSIVVTFVWCWRKYKSRLSIELPGPVPNNDDELDGISIHTNSPRNEVYADVGSVSDQNSPMNEVYADVGSVSDPNSPRNEVYADVGYVSDPNSPRNEVYADVGSVSDPNSPRNEVYADVGSVSDPNSPRNEVYADVGSVSDPNSPRNEVYTDVGSVSDPNSPRNEVYTDVGSVSDPNSPRNEVYADVGSVSDPNSPRNEVYTDVGSVSEPQNKHDFQNSLRGSSKPSYSGALHSTGSIVLLGELGKNRTRSVEEKIGNQDESFSDNQNSNNKTKFVSYDLRSYVMYPSDLDLNYGGDSGATSLTAEEEQSSTYLADSDSDTDFNGYKKRQINTKHGLELLDSEDFLVN